MAAETHTNSKNHYQALERLFVQYETNNSTIPLDKRQLDCTELAVMFFSSLKEYVSFNTDAVSISYISDNNFVPNIDIKFGNLYTFLLTIGVYVPYSEWIYETKYVHPETGEVYVWHRKTSQGSVYPSEAAYKAELVEDLHTFYTKSNRKSEIKRLNMMSKKVNPKFYGKKKFK